MGTWNDAPTDWFGVVRYKLSVLKPFLSAALFALTPVLTDGIGTMAVDARWRCYFDPALPQKWSRDELVGVLYHEIFHLLRDHAQRVGDRDGMRWNIAADAEINDDILAEAALPESQFTLPGDCVLPTLLVPDSPNPALRASSQQRDGLPAEVYYAALPDQVEQQQQQQQQQSGNGSSDGQPGKPGSGGQPQCGSGSGNEPGEFEIDSDGIAEDGTDVGPGISPAQSEVVKDDVAKEVAASGSGRGTGASSSWKEWAKERLTPKVDWRQVLRKAIRNAVRIAGTDDYSWRRLSRRAPGYVPGSQSQKVNVAIYVDSSGSMSDEMFTQALAECDRIIRQVARDAVPVYLWTVGDAPQWSGRVRDVKSVPRTSGGTDLRGIFQHARTLRPKADVLVILTDGDTAWPDSVRQQTVIAHIPNQSGRFYTLNPPMGAAVVTVE